MVGFWNIELMDFTDAEASMLGFAEFVAVRTSLYSLPFNPNYEQCVQVR